MCRIVYILSIAVDECETALAAANGQDADSTTPDELTNGVNDIKLIDIEGAAGSTDAALNDADEEEIGSGEVDDTERGDDDCGGETNEVRLERFVDN